MANQLNMAEVHTVQGLWKQGWSCRRIARELGIDRATVRNYVREVEKSPPEAPPKPAKVPAGSEVAATTLISPAPLPTESLLSLSPSKCRPFHDVIVKKLEIGLSAQRIYQDLKSETGFAGGYDSVKRYAHKISQDRPLPFRRLECLPGEEGQVDFGKGAPIELIEGRKRRSWVFRTVLSCSRKGYSESVFRQTTEDFIRCLENSFWEFNGVPRVVVLDNLRAAVTTPDWFDPTLNPKIDEFARHYGCVFLPTRVYTPRHKGKIERGIGYVQENALKGRCFKSLEEQNVFLSEWEARVADLRIHGTTRRQVKELFETQERPALLPLPKERFPFFQEAERKVHWDGHVEVDRAYYSVPPEHVGATVWARWDMRMVRISNDRQESIAAHTRVAPGQFSTQPAHVASEKIATVEKGAAYLLRQAEKVGPETVQWAGALLSQRGIAGIRVLQGLLSLARKHPAPEMERVCATARINGTFRLQMIRRLLARAPEETTYPLFLEHHPLIREITQYGQFVRSALRKEVGSQTIRA